MRCCKSKLLGLPLNLKACYTTPFTGQCNICIAGIENAEFHCGKAEDVLPGLIKRLWGSDVVAVVDPPRDGLRKCKHSDPCQQSCIAKFPDTLASRLIRAMGHIYSCGILSGIFQRSQ